MGMDGLNSAITANPRKNNSGAEKAGQGSTNTNMAVSSLSRTPNPLSLTPFAVSGEFKKINVPLSDLFRGDGELHRKTGDTQFYPLVSGISLNLYGQWVNSSGVVQVVPSTGVNYQIIANSGDNAALTGRQGSQDYNYRVGKSDVIKHVPIRTQ